MRRCYLVCYDIRDARRLRQVHKVVKAYGEPWQYSVFYCCLKDIDRVRLEADLRDVADLRVDQILLIDLGQRDDQVREAVTSLGPSLPDAESDMIVV